MAAYGLERWASLVLWCAADPCQDKLKALVRRRDDLVATRVAEKNRAKAPGAGDLAASFRAVLAVLDRQIQHVEKAIRALMSTGTLRHKTDIVTAMTGIGQNTAAALLAAMPELGTMDRKQAAALAGLCAAPQRERQEDRLPQDARRPPAVRSLCPPLVAGSPSTNASSPPERSQSKPSPQSCERSS